MVGKLIAPTQVIVEEMAIAFKGDEDEVKSIVDIESKGNIYYYLVDFLG